MTAARQEQKPGCFLVLMFAFLAVATLFFCPGIGPGALQAATTERMVSNRHTGLAIDGFDPVAYFVDAKPRSGRPGIEFHYAGATFRFVNEGNRAAFAANPEVYMPRFGGHDAIAIARGAATPGHPRLWWIERQRLYLFYSADARAAFRLNPEGAIEAAERRWTEIVPTLTP